MRYFTCLTNAFTKKIKNHEASIVLHFTYYNFVKIHKTLKYTPAMIAGVTDKLWKVTDIVAMIKAEEVKVSKKCRPYKKKISN